MSGINKTRTTPFRLLVYFLYGKYEWIEYVASGVIRVYTGPATRALRVRSADFWTYLYWLEEQGLVITVEKEQKKGTVLIGLKIPKAYGSQSLKPSPLHAREKEPLE